jgi:hypothetical protein
VHGDLLAVHHRQRLVLLELPRAQRAPVKDVILQQVLQRIPVGAPSWTQQCGGTRWVVVVLRPAAGEAAFMARAQGPTRQQAPRTGLRGAAAPQQPAHLLLSTACGLPV